MRAVVLLALVLLCPPALAESRRIAIVVGNNAGTGAQPALRFAEADAGKMARVLVELGDVGADDLLLLQGRGMAELERAIADATDRIAMFKRSPDTRAVLLFYFSGHSDGEAIELGRELLPYARLKALLANTGAELRVAIVDACKSGQAIQEKGGKPAAPFTIKLTDALTAAGEAFITSSAAEESALESAEVMGSFFTHNLISGLRGAADSSGDKQVTLSEAYRYAYDRTVAATAIMPVGGQHPSYDYKLSGQGELVLSSLVRANASLVMPEGAERVLISDLARDQVVAELPRGAAREVALAPGQYGLRLIKGGHSFGGRVKLAEGEHLTVAWQDLAPVNSSIAVARKGGAEVKATLSQIEPEGSPMLLTLTLGGARGVAQELGLAGLLRLSFEPVAWSGPSFALLGSTGRAQAAQLAESSLQLRAGYRVVWFRGPLSLSGGAEVGLAYLWQTTSVGEGSTFSLGAGPRAVVRLGLGQRLGLSLEADVPVHLLRIDDQLQAVLLPSVTVGASLAF
ncbi:MAG: caspase family protein [Myxococcaceae bacterium]